jgi:hypothetical protein
VEGPTGRLGLSAAVPSNGDGSQVFVFGGMDKTNVYNELYILDTGTLLVSVRVDVVQGCAHEGS